MSRIALDCRAVFPGRGGIGRYAEGLARELAGRNGHQYVLLTGERQKDAIAKGTEQHAFPAGMIDPIFEQLHLPTILRELAIELYHNTCFSLPVVPTCRCRVATIHDVVFRDRPDLVEPRLRGYLDHNTEHAVRAAHRLITISEYSRQRLIALYGAAPERLTVIPNGVDSRFRPAAKAAQRRALSELKLPEQFVLYLGALEPKKNLGVLLDAIGRLRPVPVLALAGPRGSLPYDVEGAVRQRQLEPQVRVLGYVAEDLVVPLLSAATVFVYPSLYEGFGLPALEAMACGTPVVVSDATALPEVVADAALIAAAADADDLAEKIDRLLRDRHWRADYRQRGRRRAREFTWARAATQTAAVYAAALGEAR